MSARIQLQVVPTPPKPMSSLITVKRIWIGSAMVHDCSFEDAVAAIIAHAATSGAPAYVVTPNAQHIVLLDREPRLRNIYRDADLVVPDGMSLLMAARIFGKPFSARVAGVDLFEAVCYRAAEQRLKLFFLGGRPGSADLAIRHLRQRSPNLEVDSYCPPLGFETDEAELNRIAQTVGQSQPRILFAAFGTPKQEHWIYEHGRKLGVSVCIGVGGSFEMVGGVIQRAPVPWQRLGFEWLYRFCNEPRRLWRRYLIGNAQFVAIVLAQSLRRSVLKTLLALLGSSRFEPERMDSELRARFLSLFLRDSPAKSEPE